MDAASGLYLMALSTTLVIASRSTRRSALTDTLDSAARAALEEHHQRERTRLVSERDSKIERIRAGEAGS